MLSGFGRVSTDRVSPDASDVIARQSYKNQLEKCPASLGYQLAGLSTYTYAEGRFFGTGLHAVAEYGLTKSPGAAVAAAKDIVLEAYINEHGDGPVPFGTELVDEIRSAVRSLFTFFNISNDDVLLQEDKMYLPLGELEDGRTVWLQGTPDLVTLSEIVDWKTAKRKWTPLHSASSNQPSLYRPMVRWNHGFDPLYFRFIAYNRGNGQWLTDVTDRTEEQMLAALKNIYEVGRQIAAGVFPAKPYMDTFGKKTRGWYCSPTWCDAWDVCEFKEIKEVKEDKHGNYYAADGPI